MKQIFLQKAKMKTWNVSSKDTLILVVKTNPETKPFFTPNKHFSVIFLTLLIRLSIPCHLLFVNKSFILMRMITVSIDLSFK